jgi:WXG100 family type VII secretion target
MPASLIQAQYNELNTLAQRFARQAQANDALIQRVLRHVQPLRQGGWQGQAAAAFFHEMDTEVLLAMRRLSAALVEARRITLEMVRVLQEAEKEAADPFRNGTFFTGMKPFPNGQVFITNPRDGRAIHPSDVAQGQLGDCFVVTALSIIAHQNPAILRDAIRANPDGTYTVRFFGVSGAPHYETVKADFPTATQYQNGAGHDITPHMAPGDSAGGKQEMWPMVIEKAYAQWRGNGDAIAGYQALDNGGRSSAVMAALTGQKSEEHTDVGHYSLQNLAQMQRDGYGMALSSLDPGNQGNNPLYRNGSLVTGHAYYISAVNERTGMVTVQNPWGWDEYKIEIPYAKLRENFDLLMVNPLRPR